MALRKIWVQAQKIGARKCFLFLLLMDLLTTSCDFSIQKETKWKWVEIVGRDEEPITGHIERMAIYRARIPSHWKPINPAAHHSIFDTTLPLCEFIIDDNPIHDPLKIVVHNFPSDNSAKRIPPKAQIARWKRQFKSLDITRSHVRVQAYGGFAGLLFEGEGIMNGKSTAMIAWAMQLANEHYYQLQAPSSSKERTLYRQMMADYTIKIIGTPEQLAIHRADIISFARSFETIQAMP